MTAAGVLDSVEQALHEHFGERPERASRSFVGVDPIEVLRFTALPDVYAYLTLGMARHPMSSATDTVRAPDGPRAELMMLVRGPVTSSAEVWRAIAVLAATPAVDGFVYRDGASVELGEPLLAGSRCTGIVTVSSDVPPVPTAGGPVTILQALPATSGELAWARARGTAALRELWEAQRVDLLDLKRGPARLE